MIIVAGEALVDLVPDRAGGLPAPAGWEPGQHRRRLGTQTALLARLADDRLGAVLRAHLEISDVGLGLAVRSTSPTTPAVVDVDLDGVADYSFYTDGCADGLTTITRTELADVLAYAQRVAAITCTRPGADSPWFDELLPTEVRSPVA